MSFINQFRPRYGSNQVVTPAAASASITIAKDDTAVRLVNTGANVCYVRVRNAAGTATTADLPVRAGSEVIIRKGVDDTILSHISAAGTTLNVMTGLDGI
jgi:hypothetical protein